MAEALIAVLLAAIAVLGLVLWSIKRHKDPRLELDADAPLEALLASLSGMALGMPVGGNAVEVFENGAFFDALIRDIAAARKTVHFETFLWKDGVLGRRIAEALCASARAGVQVRLVLDAVGCKKMGKDVQRQMADAGCRIAIYHPRTLRNIGVLVERDHRKITVLDGRVAWVGGHCIVDDWLKVRDLSVRLRGPIVHAVQSVFSENWVEVTGKLFAGEDVFPPPEQAGGVVAHVASVKPEGSAPAVKILHHAVIWCAKKSILIQNPYFIPEPDAVRAFARAVERGVDVRIMVPSAEVSDMPLVQYAAHRNFQALLDGGVRILEYQKTLLHQKVMAIDGVWGAVGSSNFDDLSFETNDEITVGFLDRALVERLEKIFADDARHCVELTAAEWRRRGLWARLRESALYVFNEVL